jgi:hypothetical protein
MRKTVLIPAIFILVAGCARAPVPVQGTLTVDGKPLANANVMFVPDDPEGKTATGTTDASGAFRLTTFKLNDGAMRGSYKVTVTHSERIEIPANITDPDEQKEFMASQPRKPPVIPEAYAQPDQTPLKHRVPEDGDAKLDVPRAK